MTYSEKLKDPRWQKKRLKILERDEFTCRSCGDKETELHIHHCVYSGTEPWDIADTVLVTLCKPCHEAEEVLKKIDLMGSLSISGITRIAILKAIYDDEKVVRVVDHIKNNGA